MEVVKNWEEEAIELPNYEIDLNERMKVSVMKTGLQIWWSIIQGNINQKVQSWDKNINKLLIGCGSWNSFLILLDWNRFDENTISKRSGVGRQPSERRLRAASEANLLAGSSNIQSKLNRYATIIIFVFFVVSVILCLIYIIFVWIYIYYLRHC